MKCEVGTVTGFFDIPPYVTMVPPCLKNLSTREAAFPPTQLNPNAGSGEAPSKLLTFFMSS
uniref:Uncharacterized protein n=1 Tax=Arundo donax TaxID=35708 RepID=A0A0A9FHL6_ARUDO